METHNLIQGTPEWHKHRGVYRNASDGPAVMGCSPFTTRTELLHQKHTGIEPEIDVPTQRRFDDGHRFEKLARTLAEGIVGEDLYPVVGSSGKYSASFDGITMGEDIIFEHKSLNDTIRAATSAQNLPVYLRVQMEHQLMVSGAESCLFMASKWDPEGTPLEVMHYWYEADPILRESLIQAWEQFEKDLSEYLPVVHAEKPPPSAIMQLPALAVAIRGEVITSNLPAFTKAAEKFLANIKTDLQTDSDFADAEETVKFCDRAEKELELAKKAAIEQTVDIAELMRTIDYVKDELRSKRLMLDKLVKTQKEVIKSQILADGRLKFAEHLAAIEDEIKPIRLVYQQPDFQGAIKNKRTLESLHDAVNLTLANAKIATDAIAKEVRAKLAWKKENADGFEFLFPDIDRLVYKPLDDFQMAVKNRIDQHKLDVKNKLEAERLRLEAEEQKKAVFNQEQLAKQPGKKPDAVLSIAPSPVKPTPPGSSIQPLMLDLARRDAEAFRNKYSGIGELVMVMEEIDLFLTATAHAERQQQEA